MANIKSENNQTIKATSPRAITGVVDINYPHLFVPMASFNGGKEKYSAQILIGKEDEETVNAIRAAAKYAYDTSLAKLKGNAKTAPTLESCMKFMRDGDTEKADAPEYAGKYFINTGNQYQPGIIDKFGNDITDETAIYSGCKVRVALSFFAYNTSGNRGLSASLDHVMLIEQGERIGGGRQSAKNAFGAFLAPAATDDMFD